jgi:hypothetical protein
MATTEEIHHVAAQDVETQFQCESMRVTVIYLRFDLRQLARQALGQGLRNRG